MDRGFVTAWGAVCTHTHTDTREACAESCGEGEKEEERGR